MTENFYKMCNNTVSLVIQVTVEELDGIVDEVYGEVIATEKCSLAPERSTCDENLVCDNNLKARNFGDEPLVLSDTSCRVKIV